MYIRVAGSVGVLRPAQATPTVGAASLDSASPATQAVMSISYRYLYLSVSLSIYIYIYT